MGGVELLSREGEIAIAKRIEAGKDVMLIALSQSPITAQQFYEWNDQLQKDEILVREIIDIDTNYMEDESTPPISLKYILIGSSLFSIVLPSSLDDPSFFLNTLKSDFFSTKATPSSKI